MANGNNPPTRARGKGGNFEQKKNPFGQLRVVGGAPDVADVPRLGLALDKCLTAGHAVMFGRTRDGGALVVTILENEDRLRTYCHTDAELAEAIEAIEERYTAE